ncbi:MAG TPA: hypothetical protein VLC12_02510 [Terriglobales bacterium]|nr:hypothetical protein [Terriglobales bacterium]
MRVSAAFLVLGIAALALPSQAQFTYAAINVPGAVSTEARGINSSGEVVGFYKTAACSDYNVLVPNCPTRGFKYVNGSYIKLMVPGSVTTAIMGVNDYGDLVGFYSKTQTGCSLPVFHGFIWYHSNVVKTIDAAGTAGCPANAPGGPGGPITVPMGINKAGTVAGGVWATGQSGTFPSRGFVWVNGTFTAMDPQKPGAAAPCCWSVNGIANNGALSGSVFQSDFFMAWFKQGADEDFYEYFTAPGTTGGDTYGTAVDSSTDVVGYATSAGGYFAKHIELNEGSNDAEIRPGFLAVKFPGGGRTLPFGINDLRWLAGAYYNASGVLHGFIAKPNF